MNTPMMAKLLERIGIFETPGGRRLLAEAERAHEQETYEKRVLLCQQRADLAAQRDRASRSWRGLVDERRAAVADAESQLAELRAALFEAEGARLSETGALDSGIRQLEAELIALAPPEIAELEVELDREWNFRGSVTLRERVVDRGRPVRHISTNARSVETRADAIREAQRSARALKLEALRPGELEARLAALRASIPGLSTLVEEEIEQPLPAA